MAFDSFLCAAALFAACAGGWILARPQRAASRLYVRFAAILLAALAVCVVLGLGTAAALFLFPLTAAALTVAALARFARRLPDLVASLLLAAALAIGLGAALTGWVMLSLVPVILSGLLIGAVALGAMAPLAALGALALLAAALAFPEQGAAGGVLLFLAAAIVGQTRSDQTRSVQAHSAQPVEQARGAATGAAIGALR